MADQASIQKHFKALRAETGRRRGRSTPFATGFEDDSEDEPRKSRSSKNTSSDADSNVPAATTSTSTPAPTSSPKLDKHKHDALVAGAKRADQRRPSPAPDTLPTSPITEGAAKHSSLDREVVASQTRPSASSVASPFAGTKYLNDSEDEEGDNLAASNSRGDRRPSPAPPRKGSQRDAASRRQSSPFRAEKNTRSSSGAQHRPSKSSISSPFARTQYLEDSDSDEEAIVDSRTNSVDDGSSRSSSTPPDSAKSLSPDQSRDQKYQVERVEKPKKNEGSGMSWRAFSAGRNEQKSAELEALQANFKSRGKSISFGTHALTDDGKRVPITPTPQQIFGATGRSQKGRGRSPPRRDGDTKPTEDESNEANDGGGLVYNPTEFKTNPFTGEPVQRPRRAT
ncbi:hypothetical protein MBLNU230_g4507t1 [Neophaeotheca triangularis]